MTNKTEFDLLPSATPELLAFLRSPSGEAITRHFLGFTAMQEASEMACVGEALEAFRDLFEQYLICVAFFSDADPDLLELFLAAAEIEAPAHESGTKSAQTPGENPPTD
jgi:hypothetical protein